MPEELYGGIKIIHRGHHCEHHGQADRSSCRWRHCSWRHGWLQQHLEHLLVFSLLIVQTEEGLIWWSLTTDLTTPLLQEASMNAFGTSSPVLAPQYNLVCIKVGGKDLGDRQTLTELQAHFIFIISAFQHAFNTILNRKKGNTVPIIQGFCLAQLYQHCPNSCS